MNRIIVFFILLVLLLAGCSKDKSFTIYGKYKNQNFFTVEPPVMYTANSQINDISTIKDFLKRYKLDEYIVDSNQEKIENEITFEIQESNKAIYKLDTVTRDYRLISNGESEFLFEKVDSFTYLSSSSISPIKCNILSDLIRKIKPIPRCQYIPRTSGYDLACQANEFLFLKKEDDKLYIPFFNKVILSSDKQSNCYSASSNEQNIFNPEVLKKLSTGDTLIFQAKKVLLNKLN